MPACFSGFMALMAALAMTCFADDIAPEVLKNAKVCVALVQVGEDSEGSAFYIGDGLFVTNAHVVANAKKEAKIRLVLNSGEANQRILPTTVVRRDDDADLAVLKCDDAKLAGRLELGSSTNLTETAQLIALGFPLGTELAVGKNDFPNISVNTGRVTALRKDGDKTLLIQFDAAVSAGSSGGPVINNAGQVIGIVQSGIPGENLHFAIPVNELRKLLYGSLINIRIPMLKLEPGVATTILIENILEGSQDPSLSVTLKLKAIGDEPKEFKAKFNSNGVFQLEAPLTSATQSKLIQTEIELPDGLYHFTIKDKNVSMGARSLSLSELKEIKPGVSPTVTLATGEQVKGFVSGINQVEVFRKGILVSTDIHKAKRIAFSKLKTSALNVAYEIVAKRGTVIVKTQKGIITEAGVLPEVDLKGDVKDKVVVGLELPSEIPCFRAPSNGHCYCIFRNIPKLTWPIAVILASKFTYKGLHGHLAVISDPDENQFIVSHFRPFEGGVFIGGFQDTKAPDYQEPAGGWRWITGEKFSWTNWRQGEPNDAVGTSNCINLYEDGTWNDCPSTDGRGFIIEFE